MAPLPIPPLTHRAGASFVRRQLAQHVGSKHELEALHLRGRMRVDGDGRVHGDDQSVDGDDDGGDGYDASYCRDIV